MLTFLIVCTLLIILVSIIPLSRNTHWIVRSMDFPRLQISILACALLITQYIFLDLHRGIVIGLIFITTLCVIWQLWWILPYTRVWPKEVKTSTDTSVENQLTILTSNVLMPNRNAEALIALVKQYRPDVLVTLETNQWWEDKLSVLEEDMPYSAKCPLENLYGMHIYSRLPLEETEICYLVQEDIPSIHTLLTLRTGDKVRMHFVHPAPPSPTENTLSQERDAELVVVAKSTNKSDLPLIVTGDLNDVAWSTTTRLFRKISGLLDPRVGRGMFNTFHVNYPMFRWPLDHLFHSQHFTLREIHRLPSIDSDHFPLMASLTFNAAKITEQEGLEACDSDLERAEEIAEKQEDEIKPVPEPGES